MIKVLIATSSFKDVFTPYEASSMVTKVVQKIFSRDAVQIVTQPLADGGEYSSEVLASLPKYKKIRVKKVVNPMGRKVDSSYFRKGRKEAIIISSDILRLPPSNDSHRNPLNLTSYGLGQLIKHAIGKGASTIVLGLGGTSTVDGGIGLAQALGVGFFDSDGKSLFPKNGKYFGGADLIFVKKINYAKTLPKLERIKVKVLCDSGVSIASIKRVSENKISEKYGKERKNIAQVLQRGLESYTKVVEVFLKKQNLIRRKFLGNAGGINLSILYLFKPELLEGADYFQELLGLKEKIKKVDLVITGEGKLDYTSVLGKAPFRLNQLAHKFNKPVLYLCGDVEEKNISLFRKSGITNIIICTNYYKAEMLALNYSKRMNIYRRETPNILFRAIKEYLLKQFQLE